MSGRADSNRRSPDPQSGALTKLGHVPPRHHEPPVPHAYRTAAGSVSLAQREPRSKRSHLNPGRRAATARVRDSRRMRKLRWAGHSAGAVLVVVATGSGADRASHGRAGQLGALGTQRSASAGDDAGNRGFMSAGAGGTTSPTRPLRTRRRFRVAIRLAKVLTAFVVAFAAAVGLLFALTPSASQATALTRAQAQARHISYPGPSVPPNFAQALIATEDHRFNS